MELGHPDTVCVLSLPGYNMCACFVGDSLCASVFVGVSVWTKCLWLEGLGAVVHNLLFFIDVHLRAGMLLLLQA